MSKLIEILHELGISKVKLAKFLGVSRQMIYNYLEFDDINKWPKDKKVLIFNLLNIKSGSELENIVVDTDYMLSVEAKLNSVLSGEENDLSNSYIKLGNLNKRDSELLNNIVDLIKDKLEDDKTDREYNTMNYLYRFIQMIDSAPELRYMLAYVSKTSGNTKPYDFAFDETKQFVFESILFSAITLYKSGKSDHDKLSKSHKRFVEKLEQKKEEQLGRTLSLQTLNAQALKELGYTKVTEENYHEVVQKVAEIKTRRFD